MTRITFAAGLSGEGFEQLAAKNSTAAKTMIGTYLSLLEFAGLYTSNSPFRFLPLYFGIVVQEGKSQRSSPSASSRFFSSESFWLRLRNDEPLSIGKIA